MRALTVSKSHITDAVTRDSHHCMIANMIHTELGGKYVLVDLQSIRWSDMESGKRYTYLTPPVAQQAILKFDQGKRVAPFTFKLGAPVRVRKVMRVWKGDPDVLKKARAKYVKKHKGRRRKKPTGIPSREREFGVRALRA